MTSFVGGCVGNLFSATGRHVGGCAGFAGPPRGRYVGGHVGFIEPVGERYVGGCAGWIASQEPLEHAASAELHSAEWVSQPRSSRERLALV